jgi:threonine/homoserine/homoserine lactone efflux protein
MDLFQIFGQSFLVGLSGAVAPGPLLTYNIQLTCKKGFWTGPKLILGHVILEAILIMGLLWGLGDFIRLPAIRIAIGLLGGIMLIWMGYDLIFKESRTGSISSSLETAVAAETAPAVRMTDLNPVLAGMIISISNPYWLMWWVMVGLVMITQALNFGWVGVLLFYLGHSLSDLGWYSLISGALVKGRHFLSDRIYRGLLFVCGLFLFILALIFIYDAFDLLGIIPCFLERTLDLFQQVRSMV